MFDLHIDLSSHLVNGLLTAEGISLFRQQVRTVYDMYGRPMVWRYSENLYHVMVSEVMLQQTQVARVHDKYLYFIEEFPTLHALAHAQLRDVLSVWSGLGYNRRALFLHQAAKIVVEKYGGIVPCDPLLLQELPGIGPNTAGSIAAFGHNVATLFIETNIRTVFLYLFFRDKTAISDKALMPLLEQTIDHDDPRAWYYALMDYGVVIKQTVKNPNRKSAHYVVQKKFKGSDREIRGAIIRAFTKTASLSYEELISYLITVEKFKMNELEERLGNIVDALLSEKIVVRHGLYVCIAG